MDLKQLLKGIYASQLQGVASEAADAKLREILEGMFESNFRGVAKGVKRTGDASIREIIYHLWARGTSPKLGGELGDRIRDLQEKKIVAACASLIDDSIPEPERIKIVMNAVLDLLF